MNYRMICFVISRILLMEAALLVLPMAVALWYGESAVPYLIPMGLLVLCGAPLGLRRPQRSSLYARDGLAVVALAWASGSQAWNGTWALFTDRPRVISRADTTRGS